MLARRPVRARAAARAVPALAALASLAALAPRDLAAQRTPRWKEIGRTANGNPIEVDPKSLRVTNGITHATVHVRLLTPGKSPKGPVTSSKTIVQLDCAKRLVAIPEHWYYLNEKKGEVYTHQKTDRPGYGPALGGSMTAVVMDKLCAPGAVPGR